MATFREAIVSASCPLILVVLIGAAQAHNTGLSLSAQQITSAISGKVCSTGGGSRFTFGNLGRFTYDGLWQSTGSYIVASNAIVVTFDNGLRRTFAISTRDGALYMEQTRVSCAFPG